MMAIPLLVVTHEMSLVPRWRGSTAYIDALPKLWDLSFQLASMVALMARNQLELLTPAFAALTAWIYLAAAEFHL